MRSSRRVERPVGKKVIGTKWVLQIKTNSNNNLGKYKARVVAKGYRKMKGVDYDETFAATVRFESVRALVALTISCFVHYITCDVVCS